MINHGSSAAYYPSKLLPVLALMLPSWLYAFVLTPHAFLKQTRHPTVALKFSCRSQISGLHLFSLTTVRFFSGPNDFNMGLWLSSVTQNEPFPYLAQSTGEWWGLVSGEEKGCMHGAGQAMAGEFLARTVLVNSGDLTPSIVAGINLCIDAMYMTV